MISTERHAQTCSARQGHVAKTVGAQLWVAFLSICLSQQLRHRRVCQRMIIQAVPAIAASKCSTRHDCWQQTQSAWGN